MRLIVNGEHCQTECSTLEQLIAQQELNPDSVVAEVNREIVKKQNRAAFRLKNEDRVELVRFVGGG
ncbi:MAG: sulfur carrier protein ThiS [Desulfarculaceae bacterium]|nr:sulfur carrier protein ThiS [Desulfarculaceae bacterium]